MKRQALCRVDPGDLAEEQVERSGVTLMALEEQMVELRDHFGRAQETSTSFSGRCRTGPAALGGGVSPSWLRTAAPG
ncbi:gas vesicle protein K [Polymorphospora sp. NPDC050346]|uniref:gas vesicle protein K n=1 Tax=Polymorphospora sp. NPDC050346 TaxID=3155780 RepID=UPI00340DB95B